MVVSVDREKVTEVTGTQGHADSLQMPLSRGDVRRNGRTGCRAGSMERKSEGGSVSAHVPSEATDELTPIFRRFSGRSHHRDPGNGVDARGLSPKLSPGSRSLSHRLRRCAMKRIATMIC